MIKLSILIPSIFERSDSFNSLVNNLKAQISSCGFDNSVSVISLIDKRGDMSVGHKRNSLIEMAKSEYIVFVDDDDIPSNDYVLELMTAIKLNPDVIPINGFMTTNGINPVYWEMGLGLPYDSTQVNGKTIYRRFPNHIACMKRELILPYKFKDISFGEDYEWAKRLNDDKVFKTEFRITQPLYHYVFTKQRRANNSKSL
jgi:glycosyltransferase involved in cell wall biosynthesis